MCCLVGREGCLEMDDAVDASTKEPYSFMSGTAPPPGQPAEKKNLPPDYGPEDPPMAEDY